MPDHDPSDPPPSKEPGGPYFGRLLIVLFVAVAFCAVLTWVLSAHFDR